MYNALNLYNEHLEKFNIEIIFALKQYSNQILYG